MSWWRRSRPPYAVDGVEPRRGSDGRGGYEGIDLAAVPAVAAAVDRLPRDPALDYLLHSVSVGTGDGREWSLGFDDGMLVVFDLSHPGTDVFEDALTAAPWTGAVERVEREVFVFTTTEVLTADVVLARCLDVCGDVYRRLGGPPPELRAP